MRLPSRWTRLRACLSRDKDRPRLLVAIGTDQGITGWGEYQDGYNHWQRKVPLRPDGSPAYV